MELFLLVFPIAWIGVIIWLIVNQLRWSRAIKRCHLGWCDGSMPLYCIFPEYHTPACPKGCGCPKHVNERAW